MTTLFLALPAITPDGGEASLRLLWHATLLAGTTLIALLLLVPKKTGAVTELPADPAFTLREDNGVTKVCPVHTGRAKKDEPPILEGTSRGLDNYANPRGLSFLPPRTQGSAAARRGTTPPRPKPAPAAAPTTAAAASEEAPAPTATFGGHSFEAKADPKVLPKYTLAEVAKHCTKDDAWVVIDERVYDVTRFIERHPGGVGPIVALAGKDCTDVFANYHAARIYRTMLPGFLIGEMAAGEIVVWPHVADFRRIRQELLRRGLFETSMGYYAKMAAWHVFMWLGALYLSLGGASCAMRMAGAAAMGVFWQQSVGIGHDLGHSGVTHSFYKDHAIGSLLSAFMGLSVGWWKSSHNTHHVVCNAIEHDPDILLMPALATTSKIFERSRFWDTYHRKWVGMDDVAHALVSYQHFFCYPVLLVIGRWNLYVRQLLYLITPNENETTHFPKTELCGFAIYFAWMLGVALSMPTWFEAVSWLMVSHGVSGIVLLQLAMGHWSMHSYVGRAYTGADDEWYITTFRTTMNIATPPPLDWVHIGLQFQVEHHLYPRLPRHNLRAAREMVREVVHKHFPPGSVECNRLFPFGKAYHEPGFFEGQLEVWRTLKEAALAARGAKKGEHGFWESALVDVLNISG